MKKCILLVSLTLSFFAFSANEAKIFCKDYHKVRNVLSENGWECREEFFSGGPGNACFVGKRKIAIDILNNLYSQGYFDGTDGEYIKDAHYKGRNEISYTSIDEANDYTNTETLKRCTADFFKLAD